MGEIFKYTGLTIFAAAAGTALCVIAPDSVSKIMTQISDQQKKELHKCQ